MTHDHPPPDTPKILEVLEPFVDFCACQMRFGANDFAHRHDPHRGHGLHDNLVRRDYKISVFKKRIGISTNTITYDMVPPALGPATSPARPPLLICRDRLGGSRLTGTPAGVPALPMLDDGPRCLGLRAGIRLGMLVHQLTRIHHHKPERLRNDAAVA